MNFALVMVNKGIGAWRYEPNMSVVFSGEESLVDSGCDVFAQASRTSDAKLRRTQFS